MAAAYGWPLNLFGRLGSVSSGSNPSLATFTLDETADRIETIFIAEEEITLTRLFASVTSITGSPTLQISIQGVTTSARADGTILASGNALATWTGAVAAGWQTLNSSVAISRGSRYCIVVQNNTAATSAVLATTQNQTAIVTNMPALSVYNNTGAALTRLANQPIFGYGSSTAVYGFPASAYGSTNVTSSGTTRYGNRIVIPSGWTSTYQVVGVMTNVRLTTGSELDLEFYLGTGASDTTINASYTTHVAGYVTATTHSLQSLYFAKSTLDTLNSTDGFRVCFKSNNGNQIVLPYYDVQANADWEAFGCGLDCYSTSRSTGNWTDITTRRYWIIPLIADLTASGGSAGMLRAGGMNGGIRG